MKKFTVLLLILSLIEISCATMTTQRQKRFESSKERKRGATLIITKKDGRQIEGELITVKKDSLLLLFARRMDVSVGIEEIKVITIVKKSTFWKGPGLGLLIGGGVGGILGGKMEEESGVAKWAMLCGAVFGIAGYILGDILGPKKAKYKTIQIEGMTDSEIQDALDKLRKKARIRDYK
ncbi:hypothetical protein ES703_10792 [subsurface metagenome]